jgi:glycosyltransferase involved in cell wall biosynthesis
MTSVSGLDWAVGVIVPAQNEESTIDSCLNAILTSLGVAGVTHFWVVVVADNCTDTTAERARRALASAGEVLEVRAGAAGAARRAGAEQVLKHFVEYDHKHTWLANTDADSCVTPDWIRVQLALAAGGVTAVAGIVRLGDDGPDAAHEIYRTTYLTAPEGTHSHVHGANLAMRADAYLDVGGWSDLALAEDHCLWGRLRRRGWRVSSPISSVVITSARVHGRAKGGFADTLKATIEAAHATPCLST